MEDHPRQRLGRADGARPRNNEGLMAVGSPILIHRTSNGDRETTRDSEVGSRVLKSIFRRKRDDGSKLHTGPSMEYRRRPEEGLGCRFLGHKSPTTVRELGGGLICGVGAKRRENNQTYSP
ncbi:hypothetical protein Adt_32820 [Abeliophyllum distichum]|uniref:Uncharacterized protein n=1 Tax=Abeliophyllum distichum TaxID=126358 RepID=A0ABD1QUG1_9LAMI